MLSVALIDANARANKKYAGIVASIVGGWLAYEAREAGLRFVLDVQTADVVLVAFAGAMDFLTSTATYLRRAGVEPLARKRCQHPYLIGGGPVDASPLEATQILDALAVGEAYLFVRDLYRLLMIPDCAVQDIEAWIASYPHALTRGQLACLPRSPEHPWLFQDVPPVLATPDPYVDWMGTPPIRADDKVVRLLGSKGCHCKCTFCATTYRQTYRINPHGGAVVQTASALATQGERVQILSNDPANIPWWPQIRTSMASQSFTIMEMRDPDLRESLKETKVGIARFGVEGVSERLRRAFGKPIRNQELLDITAELHDAKINTRWFLIMGAPFEVEADWEDFRSLHYALARLLDWGVCQIKMTAFVPNPPAPLVRFIPSFAYNTYLASHVNWTLNNAVSRHVMVYYGNKRPSQTRAIAEQLAIAPRLVDLLADIAEQQGHPYDLFPTVAHAARATWEVIQWPIPAETRWKMGNVYAKRLAP